MSCDAISKKSHDWFALLSQATKTCVSSKLGLKRIHYKMPDGREMVEEWKVSSGPKGKRDLLGRYWKKRSIVGTELNWETEIGESVTHQMIRNETDSTTSHQPLFIQESNSNPIVSSRSTVHCYEWRIRNVASPGDNYLISCESQTNSLVVSTRTKKYYKKLEIPDMIRLGLTLESKSVSFSFANRTLIVQYKKPLELIELEEKIWTEIISPLRESNTNTNGALSLPAGCTQA